MSEHEDRDDLADDASEAAWDLGMKDAFAAFEAEEQRRADQRSSESSSGLGLSSTSLSGEIHLHGDDEEAAPILAARPRSGERCGRYLVLGEIARGGMGVVLHGRDVDLGRDVALKVLSETHADNSRLVQRFIEEAQISGQLQHPGIVPVYEIGLDAEDRPFFAMKLIRGRTLAALLAERKDPEEGLPRFLDVFEKCCQTLAFAHSRGVVHRDLKPANIMVGRFGEVQVVDWGFAKVLGRGGIADERRAAEESGVVATVRSLSPGSHSLAGSVLGTPSYMPPEQATGNLEALDERADVFSLGAILCEILSGQPPYLREPGSDVMTQAQEASLDGAWKRLDASRADAELLDLARSCLAPVPSDRPRNGSEVAETVANYMASREDAAREAQVQAAEARVRARAERKARRLTVALGTLGSLILLIGIAAFLNERSKERRSDQEIRGALADARGLARSGEVESAWGSLHRAQGLAQAGDPSDGVRAELANVEALVSAEAARAQRKRRDARLAELLAEIQSRPNRDHAGADEDYEEAFREYGLEPMVLGPKETAARIAALEDPSMRSLIALALDDWAGRRRLRGDVGSLGWRDLLLCARRADSDPLRGQLRDALLKNRLPLLQRISKELDPGAMTPRSLQLLAVNLKRLGDDEEALALLRRAVRALPGDSALHRELAQSLSRRGSSKEHLAEAKVHALICLSHQPKSISLRRLLADIARGEGDAEGRRLWLEEAHTTDPAREEVRLELANLLTEAGEVYAARAHVDAVLTQSPDNPLAWLALETIHKKNGDARAAREARRTAGGHFRRRRDRNRADRLWRSRPLRIESYRQRVLDHPLDAEAHAELANALAMSGDNEGAHTAARKALELEPFSAVAHAADSFALEGLGEYEAAIEAAYRARDCGLRTRAVEFRIDDCQRRLALVPLLETGELPKEATDRLLLARCALDKGLVVRATEIFDTVIPEAVEAIVAADPGGRRRRGPPKKGAIPNLRHQLRQAAVAMVLAAEQEADKARREALLHRACALLEARLGTYEPNRKSWNGRRFVGHSALIWWQDRRLASTRGDARLLDGASAELRQRFASAWSRMEGSLPRAGRGPRP